MARAGHQRFVAHPARPHRPQRQHRHHHCQATSQRVPPKSPSTGRSHPQRLRTQDPTGAHSLSARSSGVSHEAHMVQSSEERTIHLMARTHGASSRKVFSRVRGDHQGACPQDAQRPTLDEEQTDSRCVCQRDRRGQYRCIVRHQAMGHFYARVRRRRGGGATQHLLRPDWPFPQKVQQREPVHHGNGPHRQRRHPSSADEGSDVR